MDDSGDRDPGQPGWDDVTVDSDEIRSSSTEEISGDGSPTMEITAARHPGGFHAGDIFDGRFRIIKLLGRGGFSDVFQAEELTGDRQVALKFLSSNRTGEQIVSRMRRELRLARDLRHPNIVRVFEMIEVGDSCCLVMELVEGKTLKDVVVDGGRRSLDEAFQIISGVCSAIAAVHAAGVVHRDLKPQNVILTPEGVVKLLDFGLAKTHDSTGLTATGTILGTPDYMSPEQVEGKVADERADIYSLGVIAYELLLGRPPFSGDSPIAIALQHVRSRVPEVRKDRPEAPAELSRLIRQMTEPNPAKRPGTGQDVLLQLERIARVEGGTVAFHGPARGPGRLTSVIAAVAVVVAAVLGIAFGLGMFSGSASATVDPFADGVLTVALVPIDSGHASASVMFLDSVARATAGQLEPALFELRELTGVSPDDRSGLAKLGLEHLMELHLRAEAGEGGRIYRLEPRILDARTGEPWKVLPVQEMTSLDFEAVEAVSGRLAVDYAVAAEAQMAAVSPTAE